jgi:hypothetical protein
MFRSASCGRLEASTAVIGLDGQLLKNGRGWCGRVQGCNLLPSIESEHLRTCQQLIVSRILRWRV